MTERATVKGAVGGWQEIEDSINSLIGGLVQPTTEVARVIGAVAQGDLHQKMALEIDGQPVKGEFLRIGTTVNAMVDQLSSFADEVTRVAKEVGTDGKLGGQAQVKGVSGTWKDLTDNVNVLARNLTDQVRNIATVTTAVANGDLSQKITVDVKGEILELKNTMNTMVDQLRAFSAEVTRVAREVGTEGKLGGQAEVRGVSGVWKDLTDNVNFMASNLTTQVRGIVKVVTAVANGDLSQKLIVDARGEIAALADTINGMTATLGLFAEQVTDVARTVGVEGKLGAQAEVPGVAGTWKDLTDNVNLLANNLTAQVRNIAEVTTSIAKGDLSKKITVDVKGEILELKNTINTLVDQLNSFASEVTRVAREVGTEGKLGGQAEVRGVSGVWKDLTDNVNFMASNLTTQVRGIVKVITAVANGDLSQKLEVAAKGEIAALADTLNGMTKTLAIFAEQVTSVAKTVGVEGKLGAQAEVPNVAGTWKDLTDNVNLLANNLTAQVRNFAEVATAVAKGDLSKKISVDAKGEILQLKNTMNTMVDQLRSFASEVTRVAREVGTDGKLGGQAEVEGVEGIWKDLTQNVNVLAGNLTDQVRGIVKVVTAVANGDLSKKMSVNVKGEILELKTTINTLVDQLNSFGAEVTRVAREVGTEGKLGGQAERQRRVGRLEGFDRQRQFHGVEPHDPGPRYRQGRDRGRQRRPETKTGCRCARRGRSPGGHDQQHDRYAQHLRRAGQHGGPRGRRRRKTRRPGARPRRRRHVEGPHRQRQFHGVEPHDAGPGHRQSRDRGRQRRSDPEADRGGSERRNRRTGRHHQQHDRNVEYLRRSGQHGGPRSRNRRQTGWSGPRARGGWNMARLDRQR